MKVYGGAAGNAYASSHIIQHIVSNIQHPTVKKATTADNMSASRRKSTEHTQARTSSWLSDIESPLPLSPSSEQQQGRIVANNYLDDGEGTTLLAAPRLSVNLGLFGTRIPRLKNRCILPRIERADGSTPISRELLELPSSPPTASVRSEYSDPEIEDILSRYTTPTPSRYTTEVASSPSILAQHRRTTTSLSDGLCSYSSPAPQAGYGTLPTSRGLQRVAARQGVAIPSPILRSSFSHSTHKKYSSASPLEHPQDLRPVGVFSTPSSRSLPRHKRSSTAPLDEWVEAGSPLFDNSSHLCQNGSWQDSRDVRTSPSPIIDGVTDGRPNFQSPPSSNDSTSCHMLSRIMTPPAPSTPSTLGVQSRLVSQLETFVDVQRSASPLSSVASSEFSFVEPSSSAEPAMDILARAEGRRSADQKIREIEEANFRSSVSAPLPDNAEHASFGQQELRFDDDECSSVSAPSDAGQQESAPARKDAQYTEVETTPTQGLTIASVQELFSHAPTHPRNKANEGGEQVFKQTFAPGDRALSLTATTTAVDIWSAKPGAKLTVAMPKTMFEQTTVGSAETEAHRNDGRPPAGSTSNVSLPDGGLTPLAIVLILSAWILCALLRSVVRSMATAEPVQASWVIADLLIAIAAALVTCIGFHVSLGGCVEACGGWVQRCLVGPLHAGQRVFIDQLRQKLLC